MSILTRDARLLDLQLRFRYGDIYNLPERNESIVQDLLVHIIVETANKDGGFLPRLVGHVSSLSKLS